MTDQTSLDTCESMALPWTPQPAAPGPDEGNGPNPHYTGLFDGEREDLAHLRRTMAAEIDRLRGIIDTPELVDFPKAVHLEAVHQEVRWGTEDREGKAPPAWFWLLSHLATRALEHHKNAERLQERADLCGDPNGFIAQELAHHREKAAHHCITSAAVLNHWHASVIGKATTMRPTSATPAQGVAA